MHLLHCGFEDTEGIPNLIYLKDVDVETVKKRDNVLRGAKQ